MGAGVSGFQPLPARHHVQVANKSSDACAQGQVQNMEGMLAQDMRRRLGLATHILVHVSFTEIKYLLELL